MNSLVILKKFKRWLLGGGKRRASMKYLSDPFSHDALQKLGPVLRKFPSQSFTLTYMMQTKLSVCRGCGKQYADDYIIRHQKKSNTSSPCFRLYVQETRLLQQHGNDENLPPAAVLDSGPHNSDDGVADGQADELEWPNEGEEAILDEAFPSDSESFDERELEGRDALDDWEPIQERRLPPTYPGHSMYLSDSEKQYIENTAHGRNRRAAERRLLYQPASVKKFPYGQAGKTYNNIHGVGSGQGTAYQRYQEEVAEGPDSVNEWAPFESRVDWEIARWAKLRGPGSSALDELLAIEGVCKYISSLINQLLIPSAGC